MNTYAVRANQHSPPMKNPATADDGFAAIALCHRVGKNQLGF